MSKDPGNIPLDAPPELDKALRVLEEKMGGRDKVASSLALIPNLSVEEMTVFHLMTDPANKKKSLAYLCGAAGTTIGRVLELFGKGDWAAAYVESIRRVNALLPDVAEDVMIRALPKHRSCRACGATGHLAPLKEGGEPRTCLECEGLGRVEIEPDIERQKVALQVGGLLKTGGGINIDNSQKTVNAPMTVIKSSPDFRAATDAILYPGRLKAIAAPPIPVEAEVVKEEAKVDVLPEDHQ